jgi:glycerate kinase
MRIIIAPNAFKGSLTALRAAEAVREGILRVLPDAETVLMPIADGGDGTMDVLVQSTGGQFVECDVTAALGETIRAAFGVLGDKQTAVIEMAAASGLRLVPEEKRNPLLTTTYGTGELIRAALDFGCRKLIIGIGGSATVDGGAGMAQALGVELLDTRGKEIARGGGALTQLAHINISSLDSRIQETEIIAACDVDNPLTGEQGAARIFGPQKGATPEMVEQLETSLAYFAAVIARDVGKNVLSLKGGGAAGGLAAGLAAFLNARLQPGVELVLDTLHIDEQLKSADLLITGEGKIDGQTAQGKAPIGVAKRAKRYNVPVIALAGGLGEDAAAVYEHGIDALLPIVARPMPLDDAMQNAYPLIADAAERAMRLMKIGGRLGLPQVWC